MRSNLTLTLTLYVCLLAGSLSAQNENPFELLWRKDPSLASKAVPSAPPLAPITSPATVAKPAETTPPVVVTPPPVTPTAKPDTVRPEVIRIPEPDTSSVSSDSTDPTKVAESHEQGHRFLDSLMAVSSVEAEPSDSIADTPSVAAAVPVVPNVGRDEETTRATPLSYIIVFALIFALLAWAMSINRELLQKIYRAALNENLSSLLYREQRFATTQYLYYTIYLIFFLNGGMFLYFVSANVGWTASVFSSLWGCIGLVTAIYLLRHLTLSILGSSFPITKETTHFSFSIVLHNILLGIGLIPFNLLLAFGPEGFHQPVAITGLVLCGGVYLMRQFRGLLISGSLLGVNPFRFFIYLCAVEILPLLTLVNLFHN